MKNKTRSHSWDDDQCVHGLRTSQHVQEEVHGYVVVKINTNDGHNDDVPSQSENRDGKENHKEGYLVRSKDRETQEDEFCHFHEVLSLHSTISVP